MIELLLKFKWWVKSVEEIYRLILVLTSGDLVKSKRKDKKLRFAKLITL